MYYAIDDYTDPRLKHTDTVWLQHGVGRNSRFWYRWVPALARRYGVVRRDMRGHGQAADPGPDHVWSIDELVEDMRAFSTRSGSIACITSASLSVNPWRGLRDNVAGALEEPHRVLIADRHSGLGAQGSDRQ
jgi:hypothetical protein